MSKSLVTVYHVVWGYLGGGVDSVVDSYLEIDDMPNSLVESKVIIVRPNVATGAKLPRKGRDVRVIYHSPGMFLRTARLVAREIDTRSSSVVFLNGFNASILGLGIRLFLNGYESFVSSYHGNYFARSKIGKVKARIFDALELLFFRRYANTIIAVSDYSARVLQAKKVDRDKIFVLHNAISGSAPFKSYPDASFDKVGYSNTVRFITVSRLAPQKGVDVLLRAFAGLIKRMDNVELTVVGGGPLQRELVLLADDLGLSDHVRFVGQQSDIAERLVTSDVFAMTSRQEDHSISILEAMRAGLPVLVTDVGGNAESITHGNEGFLVPDMDHREAEEFMYKLAQSHELRQAVGTAARVKFDAQFESGVMLKKLSSLVHNISHSRK